MPDMSRYHPQPYVRLQHPEWSRNATIYQINTRQFTPEGHIRRRQLPRLKALGITIVWLMPIHEIGVHNRKGTLGSPIRQRLLQRQSRIRHRGRSQALRMRRMISVCMSSSTGLPTTQRGITC